MRGFDPKDFPDYYTYKTHRNELERAQRTTKSLFDVWNAATNLFPIHSGYYYEIMSLLDDAVQVGYERALDMPHKSNTYDIDETTLSGYPKKCRFCTHQYFVYGCDERCEYVDDGFPCDLEVKEHLD